MDLQELTTVTSPEFREELESVLDEDPARIALSGRPNARLLSEQVDCLRRARQKLPEFHRVRAVMTRRLLEQSSGQAAAAVKEYSGTSLLDLTCGLGGDALEMSRRFSEVTALEADPVSAEIARFNMALLGAGNVRVVCCRAEQWLTQCGRYDMIYADPDRRPSGRRVASISECSPDITALLPEILSRTGLLAVKLSPLFDHSEAVRLLGGHVAVRAVSVGGECKELIAETGEEVGEATVTAVAAGKGSYTALSREPEHPDGDISDPAVGWVETADASLRKLRIAAQYMRDRGAAYWTPTGGCGFFTSRPPEGALGKVMRVERILPYKPRLLKETVQGPIEVSMQDFPMDRSGIFRALGTREGNGPSWLFVGDGHRLWAVRTAMES